MKGWFDAFRTDGGPTLYSYSNRTPVTGDVPTITLYVVFFTLFIAFIIIFPGVRKERFTTFTSVTLSLFVGSAILVSKYGSAWHVADTSIMSYYRAFSREKLSADLGVHIGLMHFNVTFQGLSSSNDSYPGEDIDYNERFRWESPTEIQDEFRAALVKGLPYPILTVVEYFSMDDEGFCWGRQYRLAGYYGSICLWASFASWMLMNLLIVVVPRYGAYQMVITGGLMLTTNFLYYLLIPLRPPMIRFDDHILMFQFGWCYWLVLIAGGSCVVIGGLIAILDLMFPHKFSTILEVDYDTPYDRHIIIEESIDTRKKKGSKRSLEEPDSLGFGRKILRTLSKRSKGDGDELDVRLSNQYTGHINNGFEIENPPKSPWNYPHIMYPGIGGGGGPGNFELRGQYANAFAKNPALARLAAPNTPSNKSPKSVSFRRASRLETTYAVEGLGGRTKRSDSKDSATSSSSSGIDLQLERNNELPINFQNQFKPPLLQRSESQESGSSISSFGLGLLSRQHSRIDKKLSSSQNSIPHAHTSVTKMKSSSNSSPLSPLTLHNRNSSSPADEHHYYIEGHLPLSRIHYKQAPHIGLHLPRASLERKISNSSNGNSGSNPNSRRGSDNSTTSAATTTSSSHSHSSSSKRSRSGSSGFSSNSYTYDNAIIVMKNHKKRMSPDGHEGIRKSSHDSNILHEDDW